MTRFVSCVPAISTPYGFGHGLVYQAPSDDPPIERGQCVWIPYGKKDVPGVVWGEASAPSTFTAKQISSFMGWSLTSQSTEWIDALSRHSLQTLSSLMQMVLPSSLFLGTAMHPKATPPLLLQERQEDSTLSRPLDTHYWVDPVSQSHEVEEVIVHVRESHVGQHLLLVPTEEDVERWNHLGAPYTGSMTPSKKRSLWSRIANQEPVSVIGTPASLFLPWSSLRSIHILREHDHAFSLSFQAPQFDGREAAQILAHVWSIPLISYSATPRMSTYATTS